jgi:tetratricopeptide (TPR) repeat protein
MPFDWGEKFLDLVSGGLPAMAKALPAHWRRQVAVRLQDFNPFATIAANEDLLRALRLAWIEAALEVDAVARHRSVLPEASASLPEVVRFSGLVRVELYRLRHEACDRSKHPGSTAIDVHLDHVLLHVPDFIRAADGPKPGDVMARNFGSTLGALVGWPEREVPNVYGLVAVDGIPLEGRSAGRAFGELVFSAFAEIIKSPDRYPEAGTAFQVAIGGLSRELAQATLNVLAGIDDKVDRVVRQIEAMPQNGEHLEAYLGRADSLWTQSAAEIREQVARVEGSVNAAAAAAVLQHESSRAQLEQILGAIESLGRVGVGPNQVARETVLALARRLRPDELLDFDQAVREIEFAIDVALQVEAKGQSELARSPIDEVTKHVAELTGKGLIQEAADSIDGALLELERRESAQRQSLLQQRDELLTASMQQGVLLRDIQRVVDAVRGLAEISEPVRPAASENLRAALEMFIAQGCNRRTTLYLDVAVALARTRALSAEGATERGESYLLLGNALLRRGEREVGGTCLEEAIESYRAALREYQRHEKAKEWGAAQNNLGTALISLAERTGDPAQFGEAAVALRAALEVRRRDDAPLDWAMTQNNLGNALWALGQRIPDRARIEEAVQAYRAALTERTRERAPADWATTQGNLGGALVARSGFETDTASLEEGVAAYRLALEERKRECAPLDWAFTQRSMASALLAQGRRESGSERLTEAAEALRAALEEFSEEGAPMLWAATQDSLGDALCAIAQRTGDIAGLDGAVEAYRAALRQRTRERVPVQWASTQSSLGEALWALGNRIGDLSRLHEAAEIFRGVLGALDRSSAPMSWASNQANLGAVLLAIGEKAQGTTYLDEAVESFTAALEGFVREQAPLVWATVQSNLGSALRYLGERSGDTQLLLESVEACRRALQVQDREHVPSGWASTQAQLGLALRSLGEREAGTDKLNEAMRALRSAAEVFTPEYWPERSSNLVAEIETTRRLVSERAG